MMMDEFPVVYATRHTSSEVVSASRSGGIFTALTDYVLHSGGVVYGCALSSTFDAIHVRADSADGRNNMRGSKYVQSNLNDTFSLAKKDLMEGKIVLFSGTSCQIAGLRAFLHGDCENLYCVDIVCHGVPSGRVWDEYLKWQEDKHHKAVTNVDFRDKTTFGWADHIETISFEGKGTSHSNIFRNIFYSNLALRPCCYRCPYKDIVHPGDITIADYWGVEKAAPEFNDNKGVSLVMINSIKGNTIFDVAKSDLVLCKTKIEDSMQKPLEMPEAEPKNRSLFWSDFASKHFDDIAVKYGGFSFWNSLKIIKRRIRNALSH